MEEDGFTVERLKELQEVNTRLELLVCELLLKNQNLRVQLATERESFEDLHSL